MALPAGVAEVGLGQLLQCLNRALVQRLNLGERHSVLEHVAEHHQWPHRGFRNSCVFGVIAQCADMRCERRRPRGRRGLTVLESLLAMTHQEE